MAKTLIGAVYGGILIATVFYVIWLDSKVEELDNAMYQHMKDEFNAKAVMKSAAGE